MRYRRHLFTAAVALSLLLTTALSAPAAPRGLRVTTRGETLEFYQDFQAIVIGIDDYTLWPKLSSAVADARAVSGKLLEMGYDVKLVTDPDAETLRFVLNQVAWQKGREPNRAMLVYFAGHGATVRLADSSQLGYIVPRDCPLPNLDPIGFDAKAVSMRDIEMLALKIQSRHVLMLFDACFSGSLFSLTRAAPAEITAKSLQPVRQFITSGDADEEVPDQSLFNAGLLEALDGQGDFNRDGYLTGSELGLFLQTHVIRYSNGAQHPQYGKIRNPLLDKGDYVFALNPAAPSAAPHEGSVAGLSEGFAQLQMEQERLAAEKALVEKQQINLAVLSQEARTPFVRLRSQPAKIDHGMLVGMIKQHDFFENQENPLGKFENKMVEKGEGLVVDYRTGLMWHKAGSSRTLDWGRAKNFIEDLNRERFGGFDDWRLPTMEELASLLQAAPQGGRHSPAVFAEGPERCWSSDRPVEKKKSPNEGRFSRSWAWLVNFKTGQIDWAIWSDISGPSSIVMPDNRNNDNYVRAVRTATE